MNATINQNTAGVGELAAFPFKPLPLALPEPFESKCARVGIEPWMIAVDPERPEYFAKEFNDTRHKLGALEAFARMNAVSFFSQSGIFGYWGTYHLLDDVVIRERRWPGNVTLYDLFKERLSYLAHRIAEDAVTERNIARERAKTRRELKKFDAKRFARAVA